jgi:hypothetical protein
MRKLAERIFEHFFSLRWGPKGFDTKIGFRTGGDLRKSVCECVL